MNPNLHQNIERRLGKNPSLKSEFQSMFLIEVLRSLFHKKRLTKSKKTQIKQEQPLIPKNKTSDLELSLRN